jgi:hypothetical protein
MNKLFIGLLIIAAGAGVFFLLRKKSTATVTPNEIKKEWIVGKWKTESYQPAKDSAQPLYRYDFLKGGNVLRSLSDSAKTDSLHYEWNRNNELVWKEKGSDSTGNVFAVLHLSQDSLQLKGKDSSAILFTKVK